MLKKAKAVSVSTNKNEILSDFVVASADYAHVENKLLEKIIEIIQKNIGKAKVFLLITIILFRNK